MPAATPPAVTPRSTPDDRLLWVMLLALTSGFALSQAFRTTGAILAVPLQREFRLSPQQIGFFAAAFHFAFGGMQLLMGIGIDLYGVRRTILLASPLTVAGAALAAVAPSFPVLVAGQVLIGFGCAPAFLVCTVFIARHFAPARFAAVSGLVMGLSSVGMLATGTPLAWLVQALSWRAGFAVLAAASALAWLVIYMRVHEPASANAQPTGPRMAAGAALRSYGVLLRQRHTWGIVALSAVAYASFITLRGLWLGPLLTERNAFSLIDSGNAVLVLSVISLLSAPLFGRLDPGDATRRHWIVICALVTAALFGVMAFTHRAALEMACAIGMGLLSGYTVLQYADVRRAYPAAQTGRAMAVFTMAMFLGVAVMQWFTGAVASVAQAHGVEPYTAVLVVIALVLVAGTGAFTWLPAPGESASSVQAKNRR